MSVLIFKVVIPKVNALCVVLLSVNMLNPVQLNVIVLIYNSAESHLSECRGTYTADDKLIKTRRSPTIFQNMKQSYLVPFVLQLGPKLFRQ